MDKATAMNRLSQIYEKHRRKLWIAQAVVLLGVGLLVGMWMRGNGSMAHGTAAQEDHFGHAHVGQQLPAHRDLIAENPVGHHQQFFGFFAAGAVVAAAFRSRVAAGMAKMAAVSMVMVVRKTRRRLGKLIHNSTSFSGRIGFVRVSNNGFFRTSADAPPPPRPPAAGDCPEQRVENRP